MKTLTCIILATLLTGCAGPGGRQFMQGFAAGLNGGQSTAQHDQQSMMLLQNIKAHQLTDNQCFQNCTQAGYQYGLCQSRCSY